MSPPAIFFTLLFESKLIIGLVRGLVCNFSQANVKKTSILSGGATHKSGGPRPPPPQNLKNLFYSIYYLHFKKM